MYTCPKCGSTRVFELRIDPDCIKYADCFQVNGDDAYEPNDPAFDVTDTPYVGIYYCLKCHAIWNCE